MATVTIRTNGTSTSGTTVGSELFNGGTLDNAASEESLQELLDTTKKIHDTLLKSSTTSIASGGATSSISGLVDAQGNLLENTEELSETIEELVPPFISFSELIAPELVGLAVLYEGAKALGTIFAGTVEELGGGVTSAGKYLDVFSNALKGIPIIGGIIGMFTDVVEIAVRAIEGMTKELYETNKIGAAFNNSILEMRAAAGKAGMSLEMYSKIVTVNAKIMAQLGGTVTEGAEKFSRISNITLKQFGDSLGNMGVSMDDYADELPEILSLYTAGTGGKAGDEAQLAGASHDLFVQMDSLAKLTGTSRKDQEADLQKRMAQAAMEVKMASLDLDTRTKIAAGMAMAHAHGEAAADYFQDAVLGIVPAANSAAGGLAAAAPQMVSELNRIAISAKNGSESTAQYQLTMGEANSNLTFLGASAMEANHTLSDAALAGISLSGMTQNVVSAMQGVAPASGQYIGMTLAQVKAAQQKEIEEQKVHNATMAAQATWNTGIRLMQEKFVSGIVLPLMKIVMPLVNVFLLVLIPTINAVVDIVSGLLWPFSELADLLGPVINWFTEMLGKSTMLHAAFSGLGTILKVLSGVVGTLLVVVFAPLVVVGAALVGLGLGINKLVQYFGGWGALLQRITDEFHRILGFVSNLGSAAWIGVKHALGFAEIALAAFVRPIVEVGAALVLLGWGINKLVQYFSGWGTLLKRITDEFHRILGFVSNLGSAAWTGAKHALGFAEGTQATGSVVRDFGLGQPTMLHGKEAVLTENQLTNLVNGAVSVPAKADNIAASLLTSKKQHEVMTEMLKHLSRMADTLEKSHKVSESILKATA